jgi:hypothetical protein
MPFVDEGKEENILEYIQTSRPFYCQKNENKFDDIKENFQRTFTKENTSTSIYPYYL